MKNVDLIPLRALNQVSYCPRLYYLEYVESIMPINEHVEDGLFQHRRIDDPALENRVRKEGDSLHTRSVSISSERLGITGKLDLVEEKNDEVYPIEYKRSKAPSGDTSPGYWENDAIQLCAQGLLLEEELNRPVNHGILYYIGSKSRITVPLDETLREKTLAAIRQIRVLSTRDHPPEPLPTEMRYRCSGCSLVTVCQPEETLYLIDSSKFQPDADSDPPGITRVLPACEEGAVLYVQEPGSHVGRRSEHLVIRLNGAETNRVPIAAIRQVVVFGNVQVSTQALQCLAANEVPVIYLSPYGNFIAAFQPAPTKNVQLRQDQYRVFADPARAMTLSKAVVRAKIRNQRTLLMRSLRSPNGQPSANGNGDNHRGSDEPAAQEMAKLLYRVERIHDPAVLLGTEGQAAALYFSQFGRMLKPPEEDIAFDFKSRNRRPPRDPVNALLSFAYALLTKDCFSALCTVGFDPFHGFFHAGRHGKPSLALDLMEEFRAVIADSVVLNLINNGSLSPKHFLTWRNNCQLTDEGRKRFFTAYEQRKATEVTHPVFGYKMTCGRMIEVQARMLAAHLRGDIPQYTGFTTR